MKKIKYLLFLLAIICCSCTVHLTEDFGIVTKVEECVDANNHILNPPSYEIYLRGINKTNLCCNPFGVGVDFYFRTKNSNYHVGDTVRLVIEL